MHCTVCTIISIEKFLVCFASVTHSFSKWLEKYFFIVKNGIDWCESLLSDSLFYFRVKLCILDSYETATQIPLISSITRMLINYSKFIHQFDQHNQLLIKLNVLQVRKPLKSCPSQIHILFCFFLPLLFATCPPKLYIF